MLSFKYLLGIHPSEIIITLIERSHMVEAQPAIFARAIHVFGIAMFSAIDRRSTKLALLSATVHRASAIIALDAAVKMIAFLFGRVVIQNYIGWA